MKPTEKVHDAPSSHRDAVDLLVCELGATVVAASAASALPPCACHSWVVCDRCGEAILRRVMGTKPAACIITPGCRGIYR